jgi:hypothetical protein
MNVKSIKTINLLDVVRKAGEYAGGDGEIWMEVAKRTRGNQIFTNDSLYIYTLPSINGEELSPVQKRILEICSDAVEDDTIVFEVCW